MSNHATFGSYLIGAAGTWEQLPHRTSMTDGVVLKARSDNTAFIELATSATPALGDIARLDAGEAVVMPIMSVDKVWVRSSVVGAALDIFGASAY